jgi:UDP-N-acetylglucosamine acyltransferase|tara:strand:- start:191 stop:985 length:795 start_codon:yes stop_codon:yes gene_type:complete
MIDARAIVDPSAKLGENVSIGPWTIIGPDVEIGDGTSIASHVVVKGPTRIGCDNCVYQFSSIGEDTPAIAYGGEATTLEIGDNNIFREGVTVHRGMVQDRGETVIGSNGLFMAYVHIGHDCIVGDHVIMANNASVSGHVKVGDHANFGGYAGVAQFRDVGAYTHIAAFSLVIKDVPAFVTAVGNPAAAVGMNIEGLKRRGYGKDTIAALRSAYRTVYRSGLTAKEAFSALEEAAGEHAEVAVFAQSIEESTHGIVRPRRGQGGG